MDPIQDKGNNFLAGSILVAALIIGGAYIYGSGFKGQAGGNTLTNVSDTAQKSATNSNPTVGTDVILGDPNAPVTFIEFGDFQCPYCKSLFDNVEKPLREEYIKTGKVKMVFRDFPLDSIHPYARPAANAAECAKEQNKFWEYHDALFMKQADLATLDFAVLAGQLGMNQAQFKQCYQARKYDAEITQDYNDGAVAGVSGTPANFINGELLSGALPYASFKATIDKALQNPAR